MRWPHERRPFRLGQTWRLRARPEVTATICRLLMSRARCHREAWATTPERFDGINYPFPADDAPGRGCDILVNLDEWERVS